MFSIAASLFALVAASPALGKIFITQPVASTTFPVGQNITVQWQDDTTAPSLAQIGVSDVGVYAGNAIQQTLLQQIGTLDVSVNNSITFVINSDIGPAGKANYFIRFTATNFADPANPTFPFEAFSAMFALSGATGTFSAAVQAQIDAAGTIGTGAPTSTAAAASTPASNAPAISTPAAAKPSTSAAANTTASKASTTASSAAPRFVVPALLAAGVGAVFACVL